MFRDKSRSHFRGSSSPSLGPVCCPKTSNTSYEFRLETSQKIEDVTTTHSSKFHCLRRIFLDRAHWLQPSRFLLVFRKCPVRLSTHTLGACRNVPGIVPLSIPGPHPSTSIPIHCSLLFITLDTKQSDTQTASLKKGS